jgi:hypothetical protein
MIPGYACVPGYSLRIGRVRLYARPDRTSGRSRVERRRNGAHRISRDAEERVVQPPACADKSKRRLCRNCVTSVRDRLQMPANAESHRATRQDANSLHRLRGEVFRCCSVDLTRIAFQACSIDHSDISPFRINDLRAVRNSVAQNPPSRISDSICPLVPIVCRRARFNESANCVRPSNVARSLTEIY